MLSLFLLSKDLFSSAALPLIIIFPMEIVFCPTVTESPALEHDAHYQQVLRGLTSLLHERLVPHDMMFVVPKEKGKDTKDGTADGTADGTSDSVTYLGVNFDPRHLDSKAPFYQNYYPIKSKLIEIKSPVCLYLFRPTTFITSEGKHHNVGFLIYNLKKELPNELRSQSFASLINKSSDICETMSILRVDKFLDKKVEQLFNRGL